MNKFRCFDELLQSQNPSAPALEFETPQGKGTWSFSELLTQIDSFSLPQANRVGVFADGSKECLAAIFALAKAKKTIVLLNPLDPFSVLEDQITSAHVGEVLFGDEDYSSLYREGENDQSIIFFTSGTTSSSKGVVLSEESLCASAYNGGACLPLQKNDKLLCLLPLSHVYGFVCSLLWGLSFGACVCLGRGMRHLVDDCMFYQPTVATLVPQMAGFLAMRNLLNPELRLILIGAGECSDVIINGVKAKGIRVSFGYGMTETSSGLALSLGEEPRAMTICPEVSVKLAQDNEILIHAPSLLMKGYYSDGIFSPVELIDGYFATGDLGSIDEQGLLHIIGRKKDMLVLNDGTKIFCPEYEARLLGRIGQLDAAIFLDNKGKVGLALGKTEKTDIIRRLIDAFNDTLPRGQRIHEVYYLKGPIPRTSTGKAKRYLLMQTVKGE